MTGSQGAAREDNGAGEKKGKTGNERKKQSGSRGTAGRL